MPPLARLPKTDPTIPGDVILRFEEGGLSPERVLEAIRDAFRIAMSGKRGPVMLNMPRDLLDPKTR